MGVSNVRWDDYFNTWAKVAFEYLFSQSTLPMHENVALYAVSQMVVGVCGYISKDASKLSRSTGDIDALIETATIISGGHEGMVSILRHRAYIQVWYSNNPERIEQHKELYISYAVDLYYALVHLFSSFEHDETKSVVSFDNAISSMSGQGFSTR